MRTNRLLTLRPRRRRPGTEKAARYARFVTRRLPVVVLVGLLVLGAAGRAGTHMKLGLPDGGSKPTDNTERRAYDLLTEGLPGFNGVLTVVVDAPGATAEQQERIALEATNRLEEMPNVAAISPPSQNEAGDVTISMVTPKTGPSSDETKDLVEHMRERPSRCPASTASTHTSRATAPNIDTADQLAPSLLKYVAVVVGLALLLLMVVFRSVLVPIKAAIGFLLSIAAAMGAVVWVFQDGNLADLFAVAQAGPIVSFLPVLLIGILFGLAMDYWCSWCRACARPTCTRAMPASR